MSAGISPPGTSLHFSVLIPVHNEAPILEGAVSSAVSAIRELGRPFELVLCENGSLDNSLELAQELARRFSEVRVEHLPIADYGGALRYGLPRCQHEQIVVFNVEFWSATFTRDALVRLASCDLVIGSKSIRGAHDERPLIRRIITRTFNSFLRITFGFHGTETHGMKALRRNTVVPVAEQCVTGGWIFDTELVLRVERAGLVIDEIPVDTKELRQPGSWALLRRVPPVIRALIRLWWLLPRTQGRTRVNEC